MRSTAAELRESLRWHWRYSSDAKSIIVILLLLVLRLSGEAALGIRWHQVSLLSSAVHGVFDLVLLGSCLCAMLVSKMSIPEEYAFGFVRVEVLSAFANACYLLFLAFTQCTDALSASLTKHVHGSGSVRLAGLNVATNLLGSLLFVRFGRVRVRYSSPSDMNLHAVWLHLAADSLHNGGILAAALLHEAGLPSRAATVAMKLVVALLLVFLAQPLFTSCACSLLQRVPTSVDPAVLNRCLTRIEMLPGCRGSANQHFWELAPGQIHGQVTLLLAPGADEGAVRASAAKAFDVALGCSTHITFEARVAQ